MKISSFELENVKRVRAVEYEPTPNGLTVIGGRNGQGKTSILDAIAWALGGAKYAPENARRDGSSLPPHIKITLDNGIVVERKGKNSELTVTDPTGERAGQKLLDSFIDQLALDLPRFMGMTDKEKAEVLLKAIGVGDELAVLERNYQTAYYERRTVGQIADQKTKYAAGLPRYPGVPDEPINVLDLVKKNEEILKKNSENDRIRGLLRQSKERFSEIDDEITRLSAQLNEKTALYNQLKDEIFDLEKQVASLVDESSEEIERQLHDADTINAQIRSNAERARAQKEADDARAEYEARTEQLEQIKTSKADLLKNAGLPLPGLGVDDSGALTYQGKNWGCMSGSDQLVVAASIVRKLNPQCQFVLIDKLEQMDQDTLHSFDVWLKGEGLQVIGTRVSTGSECQIIIEDGMIKKEEEPAIDWKGVKWK